MPTDKYTGFNGAGRPRTEYLAQIAAMDDPSFAAETESKIWLSASFANNPGWDYHWQRDACCDEARRRGKPEIYERAHEKASRTA